MNRLIFATPSDPQVTIVIVTHGCRDVVAKALTMLLAQTVPLYELIVVDSLSPDDTGNWIEQNVHHESAAPTTNKAYRVLAARRRHQGDPCGARPK